MRTRAAYVAGACQVAAPPGMDEAEMVWAAVEGALREAGHTRRDVGFWCSGSCDYTLGKPFSFVQAVDGLGLWPPAAESHVEADGAWAFQEAWIHLLLGPENSEVDVAVAYAFGRSSLAPMDEVWRRQLDPYALAPLGVDEPALVALQLAGLLREGLLDEASLGTARLATPPLVGALRGGDRTPAGDGACAVVLAREGYARVSGVAHATEGHRPGSRGWTTSPSTRLAADRAGLVPGDPCHVHARWSVHAPLLARALGGPVRPVPVDVPQVSGLAAIAAAAAEVRAGAAGAGAGRVGAHATNGPALQQNLVAVLEAP